MRLPLRLRALSCLLLAVHLVPAAARAQDEQAVRRRALERAQAEIERLPPGPDARGRVAAAVAEGWLRLREPQRALAAAVAAGPDGVDAFRGLLAGQDGPAGWLRLASRCQGCDRDALVGFMAAELTPAADAGAALALADSVRAPAERINTLYRVVRRLPHGDSAGARRAARTAAAALARVPAGPARQRAAEQSAWLWTRAGDAWAALAAVTEPLPADARPEALLRTALALRYHGHPLADSAARLALGSVGALPAGPARAGRYRDLAREATRLGPAPLAAAPGRWETPGERGARLGSLMTARLLALDTAGARAALDELRRVDAPSARAAALASMAISRMSRNGRTGADVADAWRMLDEAAAAAERVAEPAERAVGMAQVARVAVLYDVRRGMRSARAIPDPALRDEVRRLAFRTLMPADTAGALALADSFEAAGPAADSTRAQVAAYFARAGSFDQARRRLAAIASPERRLFARAALGHALERAGRSGEAGALVREALAAAELGPSAPWPEEGDMLRAWAVPRGWALLGPEAVAAWAASRPTPLERARAHLLIAGRDGPGAVDVYLERALAFP